MESNDDELGCMLPLIALAIGVGAGLNYGGGYGFLAGGAAMTILLLIPKRWYVR